MIKEKIKPTHVPPKLSVNIVNVADYVSNRSTNLITLNNWHRKPWKYIICFELRTRKMYCYFAVKDPWNPERWCKNSLIPSYCNSIYFVTFRAMFPWLIMLAGIQKIRRNSCHVEMMGKLCKTYFWFIKMFQSSHSNQNRSNLNGIV